MVTAVIVFPGGGYSGESYLREGTLIAEAFVRKGIAAFILKYRLPIDSIMIDKTIGPLQDAQQSIKIVRQHASEWKLDSSKIGVMGFSAGGHFTPGRDDSYDAEDNIFFEAQKDKYEFQGISDNIVLFSTLGNTSEIRMSLLNELKHQEDMVMRAVHS